MKTETSTTMPQTAGKRNKKRKTFFIGCPVPGCTQQFPSGARRTHVTKHLEDHHHVPLTRHKLGSGGNMSQVQKRQEDDIRAWLRLQGHSTYHRFFITPDLTTVGAGQPARKREAEEDGEELDGQRDADSEENMTTEGAAADTEPIEDVDQHRNDRRATRTPGGSLKRKRDSAEPKEAMI